MDKNIFAEDILTKNIPVDVVEHIEKIESSIDPGLFNVILESPELKQFISSLKAPNVARQNRTSVLLQNIKNNGESKHENSKRGCKR